MMSSTPHPALTRPALLSHVFKFVVRKHTDVRLIHVTSSWEDTAASYCPWLWERLLHLNQFGLPPLEDASAASIERHSQHAFNYYICRVWVHHSSETVLTRLVDPVYATLSGCSKLTDAGLAVVGTFTSLRTLSLDCCAQLTDAGLAHLAHLANLRELNVSWCPALGDEAFSHIAKLTALESLHAAACDKLTDAGLAHIGPSLTKLRQLNLDRCSRITDAGTAHMVHLVSLGHLSLWACSGLADATLTHLDKLSASLRYVDLSFCNKISRDAKAQFRAEHPSCALAA